MQVGAAVSRQYHLVRASMGLAAQAAIAAGIAWFIAYRVFHHAQPFFAPISAVVVLASSIGQRLRRAVEVVLGNAFGILFGEVLVTIIGRGAWQVAVAVLLAILAAVMLGGGPALIGQAASTAIFVVTFAPGTQQYFLSRFVDAVIGGTVGVAVMALLLPLNPLTVVSRAVEPILERLAAELSSTAMAIEQRDEAEAERALTELRTVERQLWGLTDAITASKEISVFAPLRWGKRGILQQYLDAHDHIARSVRNTRVLVRRSATAIDDDEPLPETLTGALHALAESVDRLSRELARGAEPVNARVAAVRAVHFAAAAYEGGLGFSGGAIVAQVRSIANDLLRASGVDAEQTSRLVRKAVGRAAAGIPPPKLGVPRPDG